MQKEPEAAVKVFWLLFALTNFNPCTLVLENNALTSIQLNSWEQAGLVKRFLLIITALLAMLGLLFATPHVYERLRRTNSSAAAALNNLSSQEIGPAIINCLQKLNPNIYDAQRTNQLLEDRGLKAKYYIINGRLGWHTTWVALIALGEDPITSYDIFSTGTNRTKSMFYRDLPWKVIGSLKRCGVVHGGGWAYELPWLNIPTAAMSHD